MAPPNDGELNINVNVSGTGIEKVNADLTAVQLKAKATDQAFKDLGATVGRDTGSGRFTKLQQDVQSAGAATRATDQAFAALGATVGRDPVTGHWTKLATDVEAVGVASTVTAQKHSVLQKAIADVTNALGITTAASSAAGGAAEELGGHIGRANNATRLFRETMHTVHPLLYALGINMQGMGSLVMAARAGIIGLSIVIAGAFVGALERASETMKQFQDRLDALGAGKSGMSIIKESADSTKSSVSSLEPVFEKLIGYQAQFAASKGINFLDPESANSFGMGIKAAAGQVDALSKGLQLSGMTGSEAAKAVGGYFDEIFKIDTATKTFQGLTLDTFTKIKQDSPQLAAALAKVFVPIAGNSGAAIAKLTEQLRTGYIDVNHFVQALTTIKPQMDAAFATQAPNIAQSWERLKDAVVGLVQEIGKLAGFSVVSTTLNAFSVYIGLAAKNAGALTLAIEGLILMGLRLLPFVGTVGAIGAAFLMIMPVVDELAQKFGASSGTVSALNTILKLLAVAALAVANPFVGAAAALVLFQEDIAACIGDVQSLINWLNQLGSTGAKVGAIIGAALGFAAGGIPGAIAGGAAGAVAGAATQNALGGGGPSFQVGGGGSGGGGSPSFAGSGGSGGDTGPIVFQSPPDTGGAGDNGLGFASGGSFTISGSGGTDSQLVSFYATPGEQVTVGDPASVTDVTKGLPSASNVPNATSGVLQATFPNSVSDALKHGGKTTNEILAKMLNVFQGPQSSTGRLAFPGLASTAAPVVAAAAATTASTSGTANAANNASAVSAGNIPFPALLPPPTSHLKSGGGDGSGGGGGGGGGSGGHSATLAASGTGTKADGKATTDALGITKKPIGSGAMYTRPDDESSKDSTIDVKEVASQTAEAVTTASSSIWDGVKSAASSFWDGIKSVGSALWDGLKSAASGGDSGQYSSIDQVTAQPYLVPEVPLPTPRPSYTYNAELAKELAGYNAGGSSYTPPLSGVALPSTQSSIGALNTQSTSAPYSGASTTGAVYGGGSTNTPPPASVQPGTDPSAVAGSYKGPYQLNPAYLDYTARMDRSVLGSKPDYQGFGSRSAAIAAGNAIGDAPDKNGNWDRALQQFSKQTNATEKQTAVTEEGFKGATAEAQKQTTAIEDMSGQIGGSQQTIVNNVFGGQGTSGSRGGGVGGLLSTGGGGGGGGGLVSSGGASAGGGGTSGGSSSSTSGYSGGASTSSTSGMYEPPGGNSSYDSSGGPYNSSYDSSSSSTDSGSSYTGDYGYGSSDPYGNAAGDSYSSSFDTTGYQADAYSMASGGQFTVRGTGGTDSQLIHLHATPGENVTVTGSRVHPHQNTTVPQMHNAPVTEAQPPTPAEGHSSPVHRPAPINLQVFGASNVATFVQAEAQIKRAISRFQR